MYYGPAQEQAEHFKALLNDIVIETGIKQTAFAYDGKGKQNTVSQWLDPISERHLPAFELFLLPESIVVPICTEILTRFKKSIVTNVPAAVKNGTVLDEVIDIVQLNSRLSEQVGKMDKKQLLMLADQFNGISQRLYTEANTK